MDNVMHIIKVAVPILFALIVLILLWTLFKAARKKIKDTQLTMAAMVAAKRAEAPGGKGSGAAVFYHVSGRERYAHGVRRHAERVRPPRRG